MFFQTQIPLNFFHGLIVKRIMRDRGRKLQKARHGVKTFLSLTR